MTEQPQEKVRRLNDDDALPARSRMNRPSAMVAPGITTVEETRVKETAAHHHQSLGLQAIAGLVKPRSPARRIDLC